MAKATLIHRTPKTEAGGWFRAENEAFQNDRLSWGARGLLAYLLSRPNDWIVRNGDLLKRSPGGREKTRVLVKELEKAGYLRRYRRQGEGGRFEWVTEIYESPSLNPTIDGFSVDGSTVDGLSVDSLSADGKPVHIQTTDPQTTDPQTTDQLRKTDSSGLSAVSSVSLSKDDQINYEESDAAMYLLDQLELEHAHTGKKFKREFPSIKSKQTLEKNAERLGFRYRDAVDQAIEKGMLRVADVVKYVAKWKPQVDYPRDRLPERMLEMCRSDDEAVFRVKQYYASERNVSPDDIEINLENGWVKIGYVPTGH